MPSGTKPSGTVCMYNITSPKKLYRTFNFTVDTTVTLSLTQSKDGVQTDLTPKSNRNLFNHERKLSSVLNSYKVEGADYVFISYQTSSDSTSFVSTVGIDETPTGPINPPNEKSSSSGGSTIIIAVVCSVVGLITVAIVVVGSIL